MAVLTSTIRRIRRSGSNPAKTGTHWRWGLPWKGSTEVSDTSALSLTTFYRGVTLIASTIAGLPIHIFEETDDEHGTDKRIRPRELEWLWRRPNPEMSRVSFWERIVADEVRGNAFIFVEKNANGRPVHLWHIERTRVRVGRTPDGQKVYEIDNELPMIDYAQGGEIVHIPNWGDGMMGYDIVRLASQAIALGISAEEFAARTIEQGDVPPGIISSEQALTKEQALELMAAWKEQGGVKGAGQTTFLGNGAKFQQTAIDHEKMQMMELRRFQASDIATLLGIAPHMLGLVERTTSWGTGIAEQGRSFVTYTLNGHIARLRTSIDDSLLVRDLSRRYVEFDPGGLLRGDILQQYQAHAIGWGRFLTTNEIRKDQNLPPVEGGDVLMQPVNMAPLDALETMNRGGE